MGRKYYESKKYIHFVGLMITMKSFLRKKTCLNYLKKFKNIALSSKISLHIF